MERFYSGFLNSGSYNILFEVMIVIEASDLRNRLSGLKKRLSELREYL